MNNSRRSGANAMLQSLSVQRARRAALYGHRYDAIGRAFETGLFGWKDGKPTDRAQMLMDMAHSLNRDYWCEHEVGTASRTLGRGAGNSCHMGPPIRGLDDPDREVWLIRMVAMVSGQEKALFDQIVIDPYPDSGPLWLDRLIGARRE